MAVQKLGVVQQRPGEINPFDSIELCVLSGWYGT